MHALMECFVTAVMLLQAALRIVVVSRSLPMAQAAAEGGGLNGDPIAVPEPNTQ
jgi:hypothetical protein